MVDMRYAPCREKEWLTCAMTCDAGMHRGREDVICAGVGMSQVRHVWTRVVGRDNHVMTRLKNLYMVVMVVSV